MSSTNQWPFSGLGLFQNLFQNHNFGGMPAMPQGPDQLMRGFARWQLEVQGLMTRRAQAYLELPGRMAQCRTPQDLMQEQQRFWQSCFEQYAESSQRIMAAWTQMLQMPQMPGGEPQPRSRDYLSFPEAPRGANGIGTPSQRGDERRVA